MTVRAMKAGAVEFLTKPFKNRNLLEAIRAAVERVGIDVERVVEAAKGTCASGGASTEVLVRAAVRRAGGDAVEAAARPGTEISLGILDVQRAATEADVRVVGEGTTARAYGSRR